MIVVVAQGPAWGAESIESLKGSELQVPVLGELAGTQAPAVPLVGEPVTYSVGGLTVYFVDVGQGDAEYIELPGGKTALIDGGPPNGKLADFLRRRGVAKIDYLVMTHPHLDHYGGLPYVFDSLQVDNFYDTKMDNAGAGDDAVRAKAAAEPGILISYPAPGGTLDWGDDIQVKVLSSCPDEQSAQRARDVNACSIVLKLTHAGASILFMGDAGESVESVLVAQYGDELAADALKVGHHGSATSSSADFLGKVRPRLSFIEVGAGNSYGHPRQPTLARLGAVGTEVHRTDQEGTYILADHRPAPMGPGTGIVAFDSAQAPMWR
ncbi:MAG: hypothetical protein A2X36_01770 [Elusimicrobia bacterium GWA2_69_24]|nr:MAG: hypothetical protein A2X36_01770 [Elusimicrobia bacterium GWA2_69_24]